MDRNTMQDQCKNLQEEKILHDLGYGYSELICEQLDNQKDEWIGIKVPSSLDIWLKRYIKRKKVSLIKRIIRWVVIIIIAAFVVNILLFTTVEAYRVNIMNAVVQLRESLFSSEAGIAMQPDTDIRPEDWEGLYYLSYVPEGYKITDYESNSIISFIIYKNSHNKTILFQQFKKDDNIQLNTEEGKVSDITVKGIEAKLVEHEDVTVLTWIQNELVLYLETSDIVVDEIVKMAESLLYNGESN